jgi:asparagine synthase (glutamine-hydrolysing)
MGPIKKLRKPLLSIIDKINNNNISLLPKIETLKLFGLEKNDFIYHYHVERSHLSFYSNHFLNKDLKPNKNFNIKAKYDQDNWQNLLMLNDYNNYMVNILKKVDRASMFNSIESREPFLDHRIYEFSTKLPFNYKINNNIKKKIIRDLVYDYVPKNLMEQKKVGFGIPITDWFRSHLKDYFIETFNEDSIKKSQFFNSSNVLKFRDNFLKTNNKNYYTNQMIWRLFTINQWENQYRKHIIT